MAECQKLWCQELWCQELCEANTASIGKQSDAANGRWRPHRFAAR